MQNVLVTGGTGFIGSNFVRYLLRSDSQLRVTNLDTLTYSGSLENLQELPNPDHYTFVKGDICDADLVRRLLREHAIDTIVHFAAETHVDRSILVPGQFVQANIVGTFTLLDAARQVWLKDTSINKEVIRFHHISTDEVFGSLAPDEPPWNEAARYAPKRIAGDLVDSGTELLRFFKETPGELREVLKNVRDGKLKIEIEYQALDRTLLRLDLASDRIASAIVLASLIIGSSIIILSRTPPKWHDMPVIGLAGFLIAAVMGFWLLTSILRSGRRTNND